MIAGAVLIDVGGAVAVAFVIVELVMLISEKCC
jgi:hypothetical protein